MKSEGVRKQMTVDDETALNEKQKRIRKAEVAEPETGERSGVGEISGGGESFGVGEISGGGESFGVGKSSGGGESFGVGESAGVGKSYGGGEISGGGESFGVGEISGGGESAGVIEDSDEGERAGVHADPGEAARAQRLNSAIRKAVQGMRPPEDLTVSQWADKKRRLSAESSAEVGAWRTDRTPYLREIMDAFTDPAVRNIVVVASSQVGKSECINNMIGYVIDQDPGSILFVQPTNVDAKEYSKLRIAPMIRDCPSLRTKVADPKSRDSANTVLQKSYPGGILTLCGSAEAHALASKPVRYIFGDERDRWAPSAGDEGDPWALAKKRQLTFYNSKSVEVSTPTVKGASNIEKAFVTGTMERWCSCCPHCGEYHEIKFSDVRFEYTETEVKGEKTYEITALWYVCPGCGGVSDERTMKRAHAKWIPENPDALRLHRVRSFWLTSWVSPWASWHDAILEFLQAKNDTAKLQVVYNTLFGLLWENRGKLQDEETMLARREDYGENENGEPLEVPDGVLVLTMGVDTQDDRLEYEVVGYGRFGETWGIRKGVIMGKPDADAVWEALDDQRARIYRLKNGVGLKISLTFIDEGGHYTMEVRQRCAQRMHSMIYPIKGRPGANIPYVALPKLQKIMLDGQHVGNCQVFEIGVDAGKQKIMDALAVQSPGANYCHFPLRDDYDRRFFKGLVSERYVYKPKQKNKFQWEPIPGHERNEPLDCRNYANAAFAALNPNLDAMEQRLKNPAAPPTQQPPRPAQRPRKTSSFEKYYSDF